MDSLFSVRLLVEIAFMQLLKKAPKLIGSFLLKGPIGFLLNEFSVKVIMTLVELGILDFDFENIKEKVDLEKLEYREVIDKAHEKAKKKALTEEEKEQIRRDYKEVLGRFGALSSG